MNTDRIRQGLVAFFTIGQFATLGLVSARFNTGDQFNNLGDQIYFIPASYAFSIWGLILLLSATYATYQLRPNQAARPLHRAIGWWVMLNTIGFSAWSVAAAQQGAYGSASFQIGAILMTVIVISFMLACNGLAFLRLRPLAGSLTSQDKWLAVVPLAVYFGWLTVATAANTTDLLFKAGWTGEQVGEIVTVLLLLVAAAIGSGIIWLWNITHGTVAYGAVIIWAVIGIALQNLGRSGVVTGAAGAIALAVLLLVIWRVNQETPPLLPRQTRPSRQAATT